MKGLKTRLLIIICLILSFTLLIGCSNSKLSDDFDQEEVQISAEKVISFINSKDSESILEISTLAMENALTEDVLQQIYKAIGEGGKFEKIEDLNISGVQDKESKEEFAVVVTKAKYENKKFVYTISFTKQMKLAGLFYK